MKIIGLTRVRNEQLIIADTIRHMKEFCDRIIVYDDCSTDHTRQICREHPFVDTVIEGKAWDRDRRKAEWQNRGLLLKFGQRIAGPGDWFVYQDADERIEFDFRMLTTFPTSIVGIRMKLFDFYITPEDVNLPYTERRFLGPEYRNILMAFRNLPTLDYSSPDQREVHLRFPSGLVLDHGFVRHYGKAISIEQWEETCQYYIRYFPKYADKWLSRVGKAIHIQSDFGADLITWEEKEQKGYLLREP